MTPKSSYSANRAGSLRWRVGLPKDGEPDLAGSSLGICPSAGWSRPGVGAADGLVPSVSGTGSRRFPGETGSWSPGSRHGSETSGWQSSAASVSPGGTSVGPGSGSSVRSHVADTGSPVVVGAEVSSPVSSSQLTGGGRPAPAWLGLACSVATGSGRVGLGIAGGAGGGKVGPVATGGGRSLLTGGGHRGKPVPGPGASGAGRRRGRPGRPRSEVG